MIWILSGRNTIKALSINLFSSFHFVSFIRSMNLFVSLFLYLSECLMSLIFTPFSCAHRHSISPTQSPHAFFWTWHHTFWSSNRLILCLRARELKQRPNTQIKKKHLKRQKKRYILFVCCMLKKILEIEISRD